MPTHPGPTWPESWPSPEVHLQPPRDMSGAAATSKDDGGDLALVDENPLSFFLTPPPLLSAGDDDAEYAFSIDDYDEDDRHYFADFALDAGIEDAARPVSIVRSVSPSTLDGSLPQPRPPTPPRAHAFSGTRPAVHSWSDAAESNAGGDGDWPDYDEGVCAFPLDAHDGPPDAAPAAHHFLFPAVSDRGRSASRDSHARPLVPAGGRRSPRSWRVPSPDVFSIREETEQELGGLDTNVVARAAAAGRPKRPKKHVRFVLPRGA